MATGHGGKRKGAGRKPKTDEQELIDKLKPHEDLWLDTLVNLMRQGDMRALKEYADRRYGKPKERIEHDLPEDVVNLPLITWVSRKEDDED